MNNTKETIGIVLEFGFHEIKKYITNGFATALSEHFKIVWIARDKQSPAFNAYFENTEGTLVFFPDDLIVTSPNKWELRNKRIRSEWMLSHNQGAFHNHKRLAKQSFKSTLIGTNLLKKIAEKRTLKSIPHHYHSPETAHFLKEIGIQILFTTGTQSPFAKTLIANANCLSIPCYYLINSWKDLYIDNFIPFTKFKAIFTWDQEMTHAYREHLPYLPSDQYIATGNPTFDVLKNLEPLHDIHYYQNKYNFTENQRIILYTMMPVGIAKDEMDTVRFIAEQLANSSPDICLLVRKNPTHTNTDFTSETFPENMRICEHFCAYDAERDMITQSKEGEQEWLDLLAYSEANISVPSTVTLEFLALNKRVYNCHFNAKNEIDERLDQFFDAGFYRPLIQQQKVMDCSRIEQLLTALKQKSTNTHQMERSLAIPAIVNELVGKR
jgi:hypothetical protein